MTTGTGAAAKKKVTSVEDFLAGAAVTPAAKTKVTEAVQEEVVVDDFADIESNPFYQIMFNPDKSPEEKNDAVAKALTFTDNKEDAKAQLEAFNRFKEFLQAERKRMAREIIKLTDTTTFGELKKVYGEINDALMAFEDQIKPLTDTVEAVYSLRMNGVTFDVFREIAEDRAAEEAQKVQVAQAQERLAALDTEMASLRRTNATLSEDKGFFGFGGVKKESREAIAQNNVTMAEKEAELAALRQQIADAAQAQVDRESKFSDFAGEKAKLRELLDISSDEHHQRQQALVDSALGFVNSTEERVGSVLKHFDGMNGQIENLGEANFTMREVYAIMHDATNKAGLANQQRREQLAQAADGETEISKLARERTLRDMEKHIAAVGATNVDTTTVLADLTGQSHRIMSMKDGNDQQIAKTRALHTSGVAGVADQLSTVLQAVSAAALGESSEMAKMSLVRMNEVTNAIGQKEVIRVALGTKDVNNDLNKALADLEKYGTVIKTATSITREGLAETRDLLEQLERQASATQQDIKEATGVAADVLAGKGGTRADVKPEAAAKPAAAAKSPFRLGMK